MKILMIGHSYAVTLNRRLCREVARAGGDEVTVTVAAPAWYPGDLRPLVLEQLGGEPYALEAIAVRFARVPHLFFYGGRLRSLLAGAWDVVHAWEEPYIVAGWQIARGTQPGAGAGVLQLSEPAQALSAAVSVVRARLPCAGGGLDGVRADRGR